MAHHFSTSQANQLDKETLNNNGQIEEVGECS